MKKKGNLKIKILQYNVTIFRSEMKAEESKIGKKPRRFAIFNLYLKIEKH